MKKLFTILLVVMVQQSFSQSRLSTEQTTDLLQKTNYLYCQTLDIIIRSMFEYDEQKFEAALDSLEFVIKSYDKLEKEGSFTSSLKRQSVSTFYWSARAFIFDKNLYKNGERNKKVHYAGYDHKIPKELKKQFEQMDEAQTQVCLANMY